MATDFENNDDYSNHWSTERDDFVISDLAGALSWGWEREGLDPQAMLDEMERKSAEDLQAIQLAECDQIVRNRLDSVRRANRDDCLDAARIAIAQRLSALLVTEPEESVINGASLDLLVCLDGKKVLRTIARVGCLHHDVLVDVSPENNCPKARVINERKDQLENLGPCHRVFVGIKDAGDPPVYLGVLCLEATERSFGQADIQEYNIRAQKFGVDLLSLRRCALNPKAWPSNPRMEQWDRTAPPSKLASAVGRTLNASDAADLIVSHQILEADRSKECLFVTGTTFYDANLKYNCGLPVKSLTGSVLRSNRRNQPLFTTPDDPLFLYQHVAKNNGLRHIVCSSLQMDDCRDQVADGVCSTYYFGSDAQEILPTPDLARHLQQFDEDSLLGLRGFFNRCALVEFEASVREGDMEWLKVFRRRHRMEPSFFNMLHSSFLLNLFKDLLVRLFRADGATLFEQDARLKELAVAATTGLNYVDGLVLTGRDNECRVTYPLGVHNRKHEDYGIMSWIFDHPSRGPVRINSLEAFAENREPGVSRGLPRKLATKHMEPLRTRDRRFLGCAIVAEGKARLVVRLVRSMLSPPFTASDATLLQTISYIVVRRRLLNLLESPAISENENPVSNVEIAASLLESPPVGC